MRKNQTSMTAMGIAIVRGIESEKPEGVRICYDPYARRIVASREVAAGEVAGPGYHVIDLGVHRLDGGMYVWLAPRGAAAARSVWVDRFFLAKESDE